MRTDKLIPRLLSGRQIILVNNKSIIVDHPSLETKLLAEEEYDKVVSEGLFTGVPRRSYLVSWYKHQGLLDANYEEKLKNFEKTIENLKVDLYLAKNSTLEEQTKKRLTMVRSNYHDYVNTTNSLLNNCLEGIASKAKARFLFLNSCKNMDGSLFFCEDISHYDYNMIARILADSSISEQKIREISRSGFWRGIWTNKKYDSFRVPHYELSDEQQSLAYFSQFYDYVYESTERPSQDIIDDDDKIDGWHTDQYRKHEKERNVKKKSGPQRDLSRFQEVFLPAANQEEANKIYASNDDTGQKIIQQRYNTIQQKEKTRDIDFQDIRVDINNMTNVKFKERFKR